MTAHPVFLPAESRGERSVAGSVGPQRVCSETASECGVGFSHRAEWVTE